MFFNNRKNVYIVLIAIVVILAFLCGKKIGSGIAKDQQVTKEVVQNVHYNDTLSVKGENYSIDYSVVNAIFLNESSMQFNVNLQNNNNVPTIKVIAKDQDNNELEINPNASADTNSLIYTVKLDVNTTRISIYVHPLSPEMANNPQLDINTVAFKTTDLEVSLLKQEQIKSLQN